MRISYPVRSCFIKPCAKAIRQNREALDCGSRIVVRLPRQGYNGKVLAEIEKADDGGFLVDWKGSDSSRFPARIKAAAYALYSEQCFGIFEISHHTDTGCLTISKCRPDRK